MAIKRKLFEIQTRKNQCNNLTKISKRDHLNKVAQNGFQSNKEFWNTVNPYLTNKCGINRDKIIIENNERFISDENEIAEIFNDYYINIVERSSGKVPYPRDLQITRKMTDSRFWK